MISERVLCRRFIGRLAEMAHVAEHHRRAAASHGGGVIIFGEAGIGKTRLIREYVARFGTRATIAIGACREFGQAPFEPLGELLAQLGTAVPSPFASPSPSKDELLAAIVAAVERATRRRTTTVIVEDIHWAHVELLQTLGSLTQWAARHRLLLLLTCREQEIPPANPAFRALARLARDTSALRLEPFSSAELSELMSDALAGLDASLPAETFSDLRRRASGNPFFAEELLRHAVDAQRVGGLYPISSALPISLQGVIRERLDRCGARERSVLAAAAVMGQRFRVDVLGEIFGLDREVVVAALATLIELQLVDRSDDRLTYTFRHALARNVVYDDIVPAQALALHRQVAETVERLPDVREHVELLAHSFWEAGLTQRAAPYCETAGDRAMEQYAYEDAVTWFERAAYAFGDLATELGRVLGKASVALNRLGEPKRAVPLYERAIDALAAGGDFDAAVRMSTYLGGTLYNDARADEARARYRAAADLAQRSGRPELCRHVQLREFALWATAGRIDEAVELAASIDEAALDPASRDTFEYALAKTHLQALRGERAARRTTIAAVFASLEQRAASPYEQRFAHGYVAVDALAIGDIPEARRHAVLGLAVARSIRSDVAYMLALLADAEERGGELRSARDRLAEIVLSPDFLHRHARAIAAIRIALGLGDDALLADVYVPAMVREAEQGGNADAALELLGSFALAAARLNLASDARAFAERFAREVTSPYGLAWQIGEIARLFPDLAPRLRDVVAAADERHTLDTLNGALRAQLDAIIASGAGDESGAWAAALNGARRFGELGLAAEQARCLELAGDPAGASTIYLRLGRAPDARRLERAGLGDGTIGLSRRERDVARLTAGGKNNRETALELGITIKAIEKHLTSVYRKLGVTSRSQLAAYVAAHGVHAVEAERAPVGG